MRLFLDSLSCPHRVYRIHRTDEDFSIAMLASLCASLNGGNRCIQLCLFDDNGEHDLWQLAINGVAHLDASLLSSAKYFHLRQRNDACRFQCANDLFFSLRSNNGANHSHTLISTHT